MCGRYALHARPADVARAFGLASVPAFAPRYNIAPMTPVLVVRTPPAPHGAEPPAAREAALVRWGLVPRWARDPAIGARMNNARAETVAEKPSFREAFRRRRCLIPADGFFEWKPEGGVKQPYYITPAAGGLFAFAGLWEEWRGPQGPLQTCCVVTTEANTPMSAVHERMPVIIAPQDHARWLECGPGRDVAGLLRPPEDAAILIRRVSRAVNNARNDLPQLIEPER